MLVLSNQESLLQFIKENLINSSNLSIRGLASLCGVADKSIINGGSWNSQKLGQVLTEQGFEVGSLILTSSAKKWNWFKEEIPTK